MKANTLLKSDTTVRATSPAKAKKTSTTRKPRVIKPAAATAPEPKDESSAEPVVPPVEEHATASAGNSNGNGNGQDDDFVVAPGDEYTGDPMTPEAYAWFVNKDSFPGAFAPSLYLGMNPIFAICDLVKRPLTEAEVKHLVYADGPMAKCKLTEAEFQPVAFAPAWIARWLKDKGHVTTETTDLTRIKLPFYCGQYFFLGRDAHPISGSVYTYQHSNTDGEDGTYRWAGSSPLMMTVLGLKDKVGRIEFGVTHDKVEEKLTRLKASDALREGANQFVSKLLADPSRSRRGGFRNSPQIHSNGKDDRRTRQERRDAKDLNEAKARLRELNAKADERE